MIKEIIWNPPLSNWIKCNVDSTFSSSSSSTGYSGIFRSSLGLFMLAFAEPLSLNNSLLAKLCGVIIRGIEIACDRGCKSLWMESDSNIVVKDLSSGLSWVPLKLRGR